MKSLRVRFVLGMIAMTTLPLAGQTNVKRVDSDYPPTFFLEVISHASDDVSKSRVDFYVQIAYDELRFVKETDSYIAHYDVSLTIAGGGTQTLQDRSWSVDVRVPDFEQTTSKRLYSLTQRSIDITPGTHQVVVQLRDQDSKRSGKVKRDLLVTDYAKEGLSLSDIMLVTRLTTTSEGKKRIVPNISGNVGTEGEGFFLFLEAYGAPLGQPARFEGKIFNKEKELVKQVFMVDTMTSSPTQVFIKVDSLSLPVGTYFVSVDGNTASGLHAVTSRTLTVRWTDIPFSITDLTKAIEQMRYIAQSAEYDSARAANTEEGRKKHFLDFWTKRDPDPSTPRNELMEEYYERVEYANKNFSHFVEGWKTDMGMVHIKFGAPDNIERHPFEMNNKPYEIWYYYQSERQFIFVDETGFGDYRLRYPTTDLWGRVR